MRSSLNKLKFLKVFTLFLTGLSIAFSTGCGESRRYNIAVIVKSTTSDFWRGVENGVNAAAVGYSVDVSFDGPELEEDYLSQNSMVIKAVANGSDAIVLSAIDPERSKDAVDAAVAAGVRVIEIDSGTDSQQTSCFIGTDNAEAGKLAAKAALDSVDGKAVVGIVNCGESSENLTERRESLIACIESSGGSIGGISSSASDTQSAKKAAEELLAANGEINVLIGINEWATLGAGYYIRENRLGEKIACVGFDSNRASIGMLETGELDALIVQNPFAIGYLGVESAVKLLRGEKVTNVTTSLTVITSDNMFAPENQRKVFRLN